MSDANTKEEKPAAPECAAISEKQFMRDHTLYSAASSWLFAIAGATNIGVLGVLSSKILSSAEKDEPLLKTIFKPANKKYNIIAGLMIAGGGACMAISNWLESKKVVTEWQLGAGKLQRKNAGAERELNHMACGNHSTNSAPVDHASIATTPAASQSKSWVASIQQTAPEPADRAASHFRNG